MNGFSVVIPTYTGIDTIEGCLKAVAKQKAKKKFEVIIIQDGPNEELTQNVKKSLKHLEDNGIQAQFEVLEKNLGRFGARKVGAQKAKNDHILFLDDRIEFSSDFFNMMSKDNETAAIPNTVEKPSQNFVSRAIYLMRKHVVYRKKYEDFDSKYIDSDNFEASPKGTTSLWVSKKVFLQACREVEKGLTQYTNEDTKVFKSIVDAGHKILRNSKAKIYYSPRGSASAELIHIYHRGPRFIDYYSQPGTRFFPYLVALLAGLLFVVVTSFFYPIIIAIIIIALLSFSLSFGLIVGKSFSDIWALTAAVPLMLVCLSAGIVKGFFILIKGKKLSEE